TRSKRDWSSDVCSSDLRWKVRAGRHPIPDLIEVALQVLLEDRQRLAIHARSSLVRLHPLIRFPDKLLRNHVRLGTRHQFLPLQEIGRASCRERRWLEVV